jgi:hypothetical protein
LLGLRGVLNSRGDFIITTTPATDENATSNPQVVLPHVLDGGGYSTQFIFFSGTPAQPTSGPLQLYSQAGGPLPMNLK